MAARYKALLWLVVLGGGGFLLYTRVPPARLTVLMLAGRASVCPLSNATDADANRSQQLFLERERAGASRVLTTDPAGYRQIDTQLLHWWVPSGAESQLAVQLAWQERRIFGTAEQGPKSGDIVVDYGARLGVWTRAALHAGAKKVVAFEPEPALHECYRRNLESEIAAGKVLLVERPIPNMDEAVAALHLPRVDYIKVDAAGAEAAVLNGARKTLARFHPKISVHSSYADEEAGPLAATVRAAWPNYSMTCGPCLETTDRHIRPETLYFW